jgi:hypothetical protein
MIQVAFIELPSEQRHKVQVDGRDAGFIRKNPANDRWHVMSEDVDGIERISKIEPHSREAASLLCAYLHYEQERRMLESNKEDAEEEDDGDS